MAVGLTKTVGHAPLGARGECQGLLAGSLEEKDAPLTARRRLRDALVPLHDPLENSHSIFTSQFDVSQ
jgi:hypothetical protein